MAIECALFGTLGRDAESKTSQNGKPYLRLNVAVESGDATTWVSVTSFDPKAIENAAGFVKSSRCYVEGKLSLDKWTAADGTERHGLSVLSWHTRLAEIGRAKPRKPKVSVTVTESGGADLDDSIPF